MSIFILKWFLRPAINGGPQERESCSVCNYNIDSGPGDLKQFFLVGITVSYQSVDHLDACADEAERAADLGRIGYQYLFSATPVEHH